MKANEAPEKLHLLPNGLISYCRTNEDDIEYVRKDAFIEKAEKWIEERAARYLVDRFVGSMRITGIDTSITDDFRNYMKGE